MKLAMEIPINHLEELSEHCDFDFALAHKILDEPKGRYTLYYRTASDKGREVWIDNSFHELKESLTIDQLIATISLVNPTHIVAPEHRDDSTKTFHEILSMKERLLKEGLKTKLVGCWQGYRRDLDELLKYCDEVALPFDRPRSIFVTRESSMLYHYFGFRTLDELKRFPPKSIDTSMPIRAAVYGIDLRTRERRPQTPLLDYTLDLTSDQIKLVKLNINFVKEAANEGEKSLKLRL